MCGLVGIYSSNMMLKHKAALSALLYLDTWRGRDSTGVAAIRHNADTSTMKSTVPGYEFVEHPKFADHLRLNDFCWIGHNRYGTVGRNTKLNAHPFEVLDEDGGVLLVGAHNGTLKNKHVLDDHNSFGTDSEALFNHIAKHGLEATLPLIEGAWALTYYDHDSEELKFIRNKERTLFYAWEEGKKSLIWASEQWMIRVSCSRADIKLEEDKVYSVAEDTLYSFPVPLKLNDQLTCTRKGGLVGKEPVGFFQGGQAWNREKWLLPKRGGNNNNSQSSPTAQQKATTTALSTTTARAALTGTVSGDTKSGTAEQTSGKDSPTKKPDGSTKATSEQSDNVVNIDDAKRYKGFNGILLTKKEIEDHLENGCGWCQEEVITLNDKHAWIAPQIPVCEKCLTGEEKSDGLVPNQVAGITCH